MGFRNGIVSIVLIACCAMGLVSSAFAAPPGPQVVSLQINKKLPKQLEDLVMNGVAGTSLTLVVNVPDKFVIGVDDQGSKLTTFTDDKGTDLAKSDGSFSGPGWLSAFFSKVSDDGKTVALPIRSTQTPAVGAREIMLKATVSLSCGADEKSAEQKDVALVQGTKLTAGPVPMTFGKAEESNFNDRKMTVSLKSAKPLDVIKRIEFVNADGKVVKSQVVGRTSGGFVGMVTQETTYALDEKIDKATVKVTYYDKIEKVNVPIDLKIAIGF